MRKRGITFLLLLIMSVPAFAEQYCVVVNTQCSVEKVSPIQLRRIFMKQHNFLGKEKAVPINLLANNSVRVLFEQSVLKMHRERLNEYWVKAHFLGIPPPLTQVSFESVKLFVQNVPGAIGYIPKEMVDKNIKVVHEF